jgi:hypothetical protein
MTAIALHFLKYAHTHISAPRLERDRCYEFDECLSVHRRYEEISVQSQAPDDGHNSARNMLSEC